MAIRISLDSAAAPEAVLDAIRADAREWRESLVPPELRQARVLGVRGSFRGHRFRLRYVRGLTGARYDMLELRGTVAPQSGGGSRVTARCGRDAGLSASLAVLGALALWVWASGGSGAGILVGVALVLGVVRLAADEGVTRETDAEARWLVERLERAVTATDAQRVDGRAEAAPAG